jgi:(p)ppGpp synthase/HD superfamily hydrolase
MSGIINAAKFAQKAHKGQVRKYSGDPYIVHPGRVANKVMLLDESTEIMVMAAWLHDVCEDCGVMDVDLSENGMPDEAIDLVLELTNVSKKDYPYSNRAQRKKLDEERLRGVSKEAKIIKLCDRIDNFRDIPDDEPFKEKYSRETYDLLQVLKGSHQLLESELNNLLQEYWARNRKSFSGPSFEKDSLELK